MNRPISLLIPFVTLILVGCGPSKVDQCNALVDAGNKSQSGFVALEAAMLNPDSFQKRIDKIDEDAKGVAGVKLEDPKLVGFRDKYATGLTDYTKILKQMKPILKDEAKTDDVNKLIDQLNAISDKEGKLIDEINTYCSGSP